MVLPDNISIIDSREGVTNQALKILEAVSESKQIECRDSFFVTSENKYAENYRYFSDYFNLKFSGII